eukprot:m.51769 g.51769  ORF g.51769 m.51769 type:complete len:57 (+) comp10752_c0_seq2:223-393(+)
MLDPQRRKNVRLLQGGVTIATTIIAFLDGLNLETCALYATRNGSFKSTDSKVKVEI